MTTNQASLRGTKQSQRRKNNKNKTRFEDTMTNYIFYFLGFLSILASLLVVFSKNPIHSVLYLVITFFSIAGIYLTLNAQFLAIVHIVVYSGAIMVLFLFVLMLLNLNQSTEPQKSTWLKVAAVVSGGLVFLTLLAALKNSENTLLSNSNPEVGLAKNLGKILFNEFALPFEISSILLLSAIIGVVMVSQKELKPKNHE